MSGILETLGTPSTLGTLAVAISTSPLLSVVIKATLAILAGLVAARLARDARASVRHIILASTFAAILALPLAATLLPAVAIGIPVARSAAPPALPEAAPAPSESAASAATTNPTAERPLAISAGTMVAAGWAAGALVFSLSFGVAIWRLRVIRRRALPWLEGRELVGRLAAQARIRNPVDILLHEDVTAPLTCGLTRPAIILPVDAPQWTEAAVRRALVHELEHVRRRDWLTHLTARALCAVYWFHPLVWIAYRKLSLEAERACDDAVVEREESTQYAEQLVTLARRMASSDSQPALAMANRSDLSRRVSALLDNRQPRGRAGLGRAALVITAAATLVAALAPVRAIGAADEEQQQARNRVAAIDRVLVETASDGNLEDVKDLLDRGARINATVYGDGTALIVAAREGYMNMVTYLLDRGADPNIGVAGDGTALIMAAREGHLAIVELLLNRDADPNIGVEGDGTALIMAAREGRLAIVELLLNRGANVEQVVPGDENALIKASGGNGPETLAVIKLLVARGANVNARVWAQDGYRGGVGEWRTPLSMAKKRGNPDVIAFLVSKGAVE